MGGGKGHKLSRISILIVSNMRLYYSKNINMTLSTITKTQIGQGKKQGNVINEKCFKKLSEKISLPSFKMEWLRKKIFFLNIQSVPGIVALLK